LDLVVKGKEEESEEPAWRVKKGRNWGEGSWEQGKKKRGRQKGFCEYHRRNEAGVEGDYLVEKNSPRLITGSPFGGGVGWSDARRNWKKKRGKRKKGRGKLPDKGGGGGRRKRKCIFYGSLGTQVLLERHHSLGWVFGRWP